MLGFNDLHWVSLISVLGVSWSLCLVSLVSVFGICVGYECLFVGSQLFVLGLTGLLRFSCLHLESHWSLCWVSLVCTGSYWSLCWVQLVVLPHICASPC